MESLAAVLPLNSAAQLYVAISGSSPPHSSLYVHAQLMIWGQGAAGNVAITLCRLRQLQPAPWESLMGWNPPSDKPQHQFPQTTICVCLNYCKIALLRRGQKCFLDLH